MVHCLMSTSFSKVLSDLKCHLYMDERPKRVEKAKFSKIYKCRNGLKVQSLYVNISSLISRCKVKIVPVVVLTD